MIVASSKMAATDSAADAISMEAKASIMVPSMTLPFSA